MAARTIAPFGTWRSGLGAERVAAGAVPLAAPRLDGDDVWWLQGVPDEGGRLAAMRWRRGAVERCTTAPVDVRSRVHEYGGGAYAVADGTLWFSDFADSRLHRRSADGAIAPLTRAGAHRHADLVVDRARRRIIAVREDHGVPGAPRSSLVALPTEGESAGVELVSGHDFHAAPRLSPDGRRLAWLAWNHPALPFTGTELWLGALDGDGRIVDARRIAGDGVESLCQPRWSPGGELFVVTDRSGWWNLHVWRDGALRPVCPMEAEFARPMWQLGQATYGFEDDRRIVAACVRDAESRLVRIDAGSGRCETLSTEWTDIDSLDVAPGVAVALAASPTRPMQVVRIDTRTRAHAVLASSVAEPVDDGYLAGPERLVFPSAEGRVAHAFFYPPAHPRYAAPAGERPPLVVSCHGGPTSMGTSALRPGMRFWTSRGFALVDVNYGGSAGFGREYMHRLRHRWGIVDVQDCIAAARHLAGTGRVDARRCVMRGASASGFTLLRALATSDAFRAGASYYGVTDLATIDAQTHKLESRYTEYLVAPPHARAAADRERSPLRHAGDIRSPVIFFQGADDRVVPPAQCEAMAQALRARGVPVECLVFEGEGHGFRRPDTLRRCLDAELAFYGRVLGFQPAAEPAPVQAGAGDGHGPIAPSCDC